jgi:nitrate/nitrite transporter NarK
MLSTMLDKLFRLTWKKLLLIVAAWVLCVVLHNVVYGLFRDFFGPNWDEPFFFLLAVVLIPLYFVVALAYTVAQLIRHRGVE